MELEGIPEEEDLLFPEDFQILHPHIASMPNTRNRNETQCNIHND